MIMQTIYKNLVRSVKNLIFALALNTIIAPHASAHLMVAQHGTLNVKGDGIFMVLSLPVSAFENIDNGIVDGIDDDRDGKMSSAEFKKHRATIVTAVKEKIRLTDQEGTRPLEGLMLTPVVPHTVPREPSEQLVIMGRFSLTSIESANSNKLKFHIELFGKKSDEKSFEITVKRKLISESKTEKFKFVVTPEQSENTLFTTQIIK